MRLKEYLRTKKIKLLQISKETGINTTKLSLYLNSWIELKDHELNLISKYLKISKEELSSNNIQRE